MKKPVNSRKLRLQRGLTLIELIIAAIILILLVGLGFVAISGLAYPTQVSTTMPQEQTDAMEIVNTVADAARNAQLAVSAGTINAAVQAGNANSISLVTSASSAFGQTWTTYSVNGSGQFQQMTGNLPVSGTGTTKILKPATCALSFVYYLSNTTNASGGWNHNEDLSQATVVSGASLPLSTSQLQQVMAIKVTATVTRNLFQAASTSTSYSTTVELRNSPAYQLQ